MTPQEARRPPSAWVSDRPIIGVLHQRDRASATRPDVRSDFSEVPGEVERSGDGAARSMADSDRTAALWAAARRPGRRQAGPLVPFEETPKFPNLGAKHRGVDLVHDPIIRRRRPGRQGPRRSS
jgi:hypothetical protein